MKILFILIIILFSTGCQNQVNLASSVVNVTVIKFQYADNESKNSGLSGSEIKNPKNDQEGGDVKVPVGE